MAPGTAPRRIRAGIWKTRSGQTLTPDQATIWEGYFRAGHTDGRGHWRATSPIPSREATPSKVVGRALGTIQDANTRIVQAGSATPAGRRAAFTRQRQAEQLATIHPRGGGGLERAVQAAGQAGAGLVGRYTGISALAPGVGFHPPRQQQIGNLPTAFTTPAAITGAAGAKVTRTAANAIFGPDLTAAALGQKHSGLGLGLDAAFMFPFARAAKGVKLGIDVGRAAGAAKATEVRVVRPFKFRGGPGTKPGKGTLVGDKYFVRSTEIPGGGSDVYGGKPVWVVIDDKTGKTVKGGFRTRKDALVHAHEKLGVAPAETAPVAAPPTPNAPAQARPIVETPPPPPPTAPSFPLASLPEPGQILPNTSPMAQRAAEAFYASRSGRAAQDVLRSQGFRERVGKQAGAFEEAGGGRAGHYAALGQMKGAYPKIPMHDLLNVNPEELDQLHNEIQALPHLLPMEKRRLSIALENATKGIRPQENEINLMHKAFGEQAAAEFANTGKIPINEVISNIANIPRAVMSSFDVSAPFRQGLMAFAMHPTIAARQLPKMFKDLASETHYQGGIAGIHADPEFENSLKAGVGYTELGPSVARREEQFGSKAAETLTGIGTYVPGMRRGSFSFVRASGRAYTGFLDRVRLELYKHLRQEALAAGHDLGRVRGAGRTTTGQPIASTLDEDIGALVNWATGRGTFKSRKIEAAAPLLNSFLFSPRLFKSRLDAINFLPGGFYHQLDPFARRKAATSLVRLVATGIGVLSLAKYVGGAKIELDPRSSDWGKIRFGNTRYDIWGGYQQTARMIAQEIMQSTKLSTTGEVKHVRHPFDPFLNLIEGKASPPFAGVLDVQRGTMFGHKPVTAWAEAQDKLQPIIIQDIRDAVRSGDWMGVLGTSVLGGLGFGAQTYPPTPTGPTGPHWGGSGGSGGAPHWSG